jgi:aminoglycoside phosphotransferase (APT) family kinase protein
MTERQQAFCGTGPVRSGYEIDIDALEKYMTEHVDEFEGPIELKQFRGGQSNPTYQIIAPAKKYVLRRKPSGKLLKSAHAVDREYRVITGLGQTDVPVAKTYALCTDDSVIGSWFYIMDFVDGRIFWTYEDTPFAERAALFDAMNDAIAKLHMVDYKAVGLGDFGKKGNYFARQLSRWTKQYQASVDKGYPPMDELIGWLNQNIPEDDQTAIVHGDYRLDNIVYHPTEPKILAILDWEISTLGHSLSDFCYNCMSWRMPAGEGRGLAGLDLKSLNIPTEEEYVAAYCRRTGIKAIKNWNYYMAFNLFRVSAIVFGILGRVKDGTAASHQAGQTSALAEPLADLGLAQAKAQC